MAIVKIQNPMLTVEAIYRAYEAKQDKDFRDHLGASVVGHECNRHSWMAFRWGTPKEDRGFPGRILRLFETGNLAEARFVSDLRSIGCEVQETDPTTGKQWSVRDSTGHFGGSLDALILGLPEAPNTVHIAEFKTHNDASFKDLVKKKVAESKPMHWVQMQVYMHLGGWKRAFYLAVNKNTDELYQERVYYDVKFGMQVVAKAQEIIGMASPPERYSHDPSNYKCKMCSFHSVCHGEKLPDRHCRSCLSSTPIENGKWYCERHKIVLTSEMQRKGCEMHRYIPAFVTSKGWDQVDACLNATWVKYLERGMNGREWIDAGS